MPTDSVAALTMYDFADARPAHDALWQALGAQLNRAGITGVPSALARGREEAALWRDPRLLLGQACEYPLVHGAGSFLRIVATPCYKVPGCEGRLYRSAIVVRASDPARQLADLRQRRCAVNDPQSNSGMNLLRAAVAPLARGARFFDAIVPSGSHHNSARLVADAAADVAAIDCVTLAHLRRFDPALVAQLRVLDWTPAAGSRPFVTTAGTRDETLAALRAALVAVSLDPDLRAVRELLFLDSVDVDPDPGLTLTRAHERRAIELGYPELR